MAPHLRLLSVLVCGLSGSAALAQTQLEAAATAGATSVDLEKGLAPVTAVHLGVTRQLGDTVRLSASLDAAAVDAARTQRPAIQDLGSAVTLAFRHPAWSEGDWLSFTVVPFNTQTIRPTGEVLLNWGDQPIFPTVFGPTVQARFERQGWSAWVAGRFDEETHPATLAVSGLGTALAGVSLEAAPWLRLELRSVYQDRGTVVSPRAASPTLTLAGGSLRAVIHGDEPIGPPVDLATWATDPERFDRFLAPVPTPDGGHALWLAVEAGAATCLLADLSLGDPVRRMNMVFGDLQLRARLGALRLFATARYRPLERLQASIREALIVVPGVTASSPELGAWLGADYGLGTTGVRPGLLLHAVRPSSVRAPVQQLGMPPMGLTGARTVVWRQDGTVSVLPSNTIVLPELGVTGSVRYDLADAVTVLAEVDVGWDPNRVEYRDDAQGVSQPVFLTGPVAGFWLVAQARF